jgi:hypothetical protein
MSHRARVLVLSTAVLIAAALVAYRARPRWAASAPDCPWTSTWFEWDYRNSIREGMTLAEVEAVFGKGRRVPGGISQGHGRYKDGSGRWKRIVIEGDTEFYRWSRDRSPSPWGLLLHDPRTMSVTVGFYEDKAAHWWFGVRDY